jgi:hypothetical protein
VLDPSDLLAVARVLLSVGAPSPPGQAQLRRAVSTAYYALFHKVLRTAAERFAGPGQEQSGAYAILYRSFDHGHMKRVCEDLQVSTLKDRIKGPLRRDAVSQDTRDFAGIFPSLQDIRHLADYDPTVRFLPSDVVSLIDSAEVAIEAFDRITADEQADVLALLMVRTR